MTTTTVKMLKKMLSEYPDDTEVCVNDVILGDMPVEICPITDEEGGEYIVLQPKM